MFYFDILPIEQKNIYPHLSSLKEQDFVLFGGTAIALQLGHRESIDFDFFTSKNINNIKDRLINMPNINTKTILQNSDNTLTFITSENVKISFFGNINFANDSKSFLTDDGVLKLSSLDSLLATKLKVINDRAEYKDYKDIAEILRSKKSTLKIGIELFEKYYPKSIPKYQVLKALQFFEDGDLYKMTNEDKDILKKEVINYSKQQSQGIWR